MVKLLALLNAIQTPLLALVNVVMAALIAFNVVLTQTQLGSVDAVVNAVIVLAIALVAALATNEAKAAPAK